MLNTLKLRLNADWEIESEHTQWDQSTYEAKLEFLYLCYFTKYVSMYKIYKILEA